MTNEVLLDADSNTNHQGTAHISSRLQEMLGGHVRVERLDRTQLPEGRRVY